MRFILLTHSRELSKNTGTGSLVALALKENCDVIIWSRTQPDLKLTEMLIPEETLLIYPKKEVEGAEEKNIKINIEWPQTRYKTFVVLDGTWQEARKIYNKSPYLHDLNSHTLQVNYASNYQLRRNQKGDGLCTAEVVLELLKRQQQEKEFVILNEYFSQHNTKVKVKI